MKKLFILIPVLLMASFGLVALSKSAARNEREFQAAQTVWQTQTQQLAETQAELARLTEKVKQQKQELRANTPAAAAVDPELAKNFLNHDAKPVPQGLQDRLMASLGRGGNSSPSYGLVSKAALANAHLKPLKKFPDNAKLSDEACSALAITPEEKQAVESAFAEAFGEIGAWVKAHVQRDGPEGDKLVQYTIPADDAFESAMTNRLFSSISSVVGNERGELLQKFFEHYRLYEDGGVGDRTNILSMYRITNAPGFGYRAGWIWSDRSEAVNTYPEPIELGRFPNAFRFLFPGGWQDVAEREGFELPKEFNK